MEKYLWYSGGVSLGVNYTTSDGVIMGWNGQVTKYAYSGTNQEERRDVIFLW